VQEIAKDYEPHRKIYKDSKKKKFVYRPVKNVRQRILVADDMKFVIVAMKALLLNIFMLDTDVVTYVRDG